MELNAWFRWIITIVHSSLLIAMCILAVIAIAKRNGILLIRHAQSPTSGWAVRLTTNYSAAVFFNLTCVFTMIMFAVYFIAAAPANELCTNRNFLLSTDYQVSQSSASENASFSVNPNMVLSNCNLQQSILSMQVNAEQQTLLAAMGINDTLFTTPSMELINNFGMSNLVTNFPGRFADEFPASSASSSTSTRMKRLAEIVQHLQRVKRDASGFNASAAASNLTAAIDTLVQAYANLAAEIANFNTIPMQLVISDYVMLQNKSGNSNASAAWNKASLSPVLGDELIVRAIQCYTLVFGLMFPFPVR